MIEREVVTSFLRNRGEILLVRRSNRVGTYQGRWSAISGFLEDPMPLRQAMREVFEETSIAGSTIRLIAEGEPLEVPDYDQQLCWVVHPFLFEIDDREEVRLDWENTELCWVTPEQLQNFHTVPKLEEALRRCLEAQHE
jgi:ADP-ribose pyrophosphatase YjhB (NUDIX family)